MYAIFNNIILIMNYWFFILFFFNLLVYYYIFPPFIYIIVEFIISYHIINFVRLYLPIFVLYYVHIIYSFFSNESRMRMLNLLYDFTNVTFLIIY